MENVHEQTAAALTALFRNLGDSQAAIDELHRHLTEHGLLSKVTLHKYMCKRGCQIGTVFAAGDLVLCAVRDYKLSPGLNEAQSVPDARKKNTLDGARHWPSHVYDVEQLTRFGDMSGMDFNCRHRLGNVSAVSILARVEGVTPGRPSAPTRL